MTQRFLASSIQPDLRFGLASLLANPCCTAAIGSVTMHATGSLPVTPGISSYLRYADREAEIVVDSHGDRVVIEDELTRRIGLLGESGPLRDLSAAVVALDAVDRCFREAGLWRGNIYLAGARALDEVLLLGKVNAETNRETLALIRDLAALELAYLFPIAGKFRSGRYDGQVQYRLNGWGRALAGRLTSGHAGATLAERLRLAIARQLETDSERYKAFLRELDIARQDYDGDLLAVALELPIPVLV